MLPVPGPEMRWMFDLPADLVKSGVDVIGHRAPFCGDEMEQNVGWN